MSGESKEKLRGEKEIFKPPKLQHVMDHTDQDCVAHVVVETPSPAVIPSNQGVAQMQSVTPQEQEEATNEQFLYDIEWSFPESREKSCSHIAKFALTSPLSSDRQQLPHLLGPKSGPVCICKSLQQLCKLCQHTVMHTVMSGCFVVMFVTCRGMTVPVNYQVLLLACTVILMSLLCSSADNIFCEQNV
jgi:hypothetical protein